jgi:hypothetical protein
MWIFGAFEIHLLEPVEQRTLQNGIDLLPSQQGAIAVIVIRVAEVKRDLFEVRGR